MISEKLKDFNQLLASGERNITMVGPYVNLQASTLFKCSDPDHPQWMARPSSIKSGKGCAYCSGRKHTTGDVNKWLMSHGRDITMVSPYTSSSTKSLFKCGNSDHPYWSSTPNNIKSGNGCPCCVAPKYSGFNAIKPTWRYVLVFYEGTDESFIKIGITNNLKQRLYKHSTNGKYRLVWSDFNQKGDLAVLWERQILQLYGGRYVTKEILPDGYTETFPITIMKNILSSV